MPVPYGIGHARIVRRAFQRIVAPLALGYSDRMDRWKVDHVEAHGLGIIETFQTVAKSRSAVAAPLGRARKKFIPRGKERGFAFDHDPTIGAKLAAD